MADRSVVVKLRADSSQYVAGLKQAETATTKFGDEVKKKGKGASADIERIGTAGVLAGGLLVTALGGAAFTAANFEKEMSGVKAVSGASAAEMKTLSDAALAAGASTKLAGVTAMDAAKAEQELVKAGISVADVTGGALMGSLTLAAAGQLDFADAATIAAQAMNIFHLQGSEVGHVADVLAAAANKSAGDVGQFGDALRQGGLVAAQTGLSLEETTGALAAFADNALIGSDAGTSLKTMLQRLTPQSTEAANLMKKLGFSAYDAQGNFIGLENLAGELQDSLKGMSVEQRNAAMSTLFGSDAVRAANILYEQGAAGIKDYVDAVDDQGAAARMAAIQNDNLKGDIEALGGALETAFITNGSKATGALRAITQEATDFVGAFSSMPDVAQSVTLGLSGVVGVTSLAAGGFIKFAPEIRASKEALEAMDSSLAQFAGRNMGAIAGGLAGITAAIGAGIYIYGKATAASREYEQQVGELADALKPVAKGQADLNQTMSDFFDAQSEGLSDGAIRALNALDVSVDDMRASMRAGKDALDPLAASMKQLGFEVKDIGKLDDIAAPAGGQLDAFAKRLGITTEDLKALIDSTEDWDQASQDAAQAAVESAQSTDTYTQSAVDAAVAANTAKDGTTNWLGVLDDLSGSVESVDSASSDAAAGGISDLTTAQDEAEQKAKDLKDAIDKLFQQLDTQGTMDDFTEGLHHMRDAFADADQAVEDSKKKVKDAQSTLAERQADLADLLATPVKDRGKDFERQVARARQAVEDARDGVTQAQKDMQDAIAETSRTLSGNSDEALRNRDMLRQSAEDAAAAVQAAADDQSLSVDQVKAKKQEAIDAFIAEATQVGFNRGEIQSYIDVIDAIPLSATTAITITGVREVSEALDSLITKYGEVEGNRRYGVKIDPVYHQHGGPVYAAAGMLMTPRGTDTIPAMLSPGEYVMQKSAVDRFGLGLMESINSGRLLAPAGAGIAGGGMSRPSVPASPITIYGSVTRPVLRDLAYQHQVRQAQLMAG